MWNLFLNFGKTLWKRTFFRSFWHNCFLSICPKISTFQGKLYYFENTLNKPKNINISRKIVLFWDHDVFYSFRPLWINRLLLICPNISIFREKAHFIRFWKNRFLFILPKYSHSRKRKNRHFAEKYIFLDLFK